MFDVKVAVNCYVPKSQIKLYCAYEGNYIKKLVKAQKESGKLINVTAGKKALSVIFLREGDVVLSPTSISTISERINKE